MGKLVRDKIPQIIMADDKEPIIRTLSQEEYLKELDIKLNEEVAEYLSRLFDNTSECYKFFWFKAILEKVIAGNKAISFEELVDDKIRYRIYESDIEYERFEKELEGIILPVYKSAQNCGFTEWKYSTV